MATFPVTSTASKSYVAIASCLLGGDATTGFTIPTKEDVMYEGIAGKNVLFVVHGSPDAPAPVNDYTIDIKNVAATVTVASFSAPIKG